MPRGCCGGVTAVPAAAACSAICALSSICLLCFLELYALSLPACSFERFSHVVALALFDLFRRLLLSARGDKKRIPACGACKIDSTVTPM